MNLVEDVRTRVQTEYDEVLAKWDEEGEKPTDPFNIIATVDVSGSMGSANVMGSAIILGLIVMCISKLGKHFITFDTNPRLISVRTDGDIIDWVEQVARSPWGGSTDIDKAMLMLLNVMRNVRTKDPSFDGRISHVIMTDGQFNQMTTCSDRSTFIQRMTHTFNADKFCLPRTVFWNMNKSSAGYPATGTTQGVVLVEGLSHGLMLSVLQSTAYITKDGVVVADITPIDAFLKSIYRDDFDKVSEVLYDTKEKYFSTESCKSVCTLYASKYRTGTSEEQQD
jgi:hypothetical protein